MTPHKATAAPKARAGNKPSRFGRHPQAGYHVQASVWIEKDGELYLGGGRIMLLERIEKYGSIAAAARSMNLTYNNAWHWIDSMNSLAPAPLVERVTGGAGGGHAELTEEGRKAIAQFHKLRTSLEELVRPGSSCASRGDSAAGHGPGRAARKRPAAK